MTTSSMIVVSCSYCGSTHLVRGNFLYTFHCQDCHRELALYEIKFVGMPCEDHHQPVSQPIQVPATKM